jgi:hypothetical protein
MGREPSVVSETTTRRFAPNRVMSDNSVGVGQTPTRHGSNCSACHLSVDGGEHVLGHVARATESLVTDALVVPLRMIVGYELGNRASKMSLPQQDHALEALLLDRPNESLGVRVAVGCAERRPNDSHTLAFKEFPHATAPLPIAIADQYASVRQDAINRIRHDRAWLEQRRLHPVRGGAHHVHPPRRQLEDKQRVVRHQSARGPDFRRAWRAMRAIENLQSSAHMLSRALRDDPSASNRYDRSLLLDLRPFQACEPAAAGANGTGTRARSVSHFCSGPLNLEFN